MGPDEAVEQVETKENALLIQIIDKGEAFAVKVDLKSKDYLQALGMITKARWQLDEWEAAIKAGTPEL